MSTQVDAYNAINRTTTGVQGTKKMGSDALDMNDFMSLLAAQLSNQDVMNPMDNTAFIAQMAQFTSLQAMQTMSEITYASYGASMIGKNVLVGKMDERGEYIEDTGTIETVKYAGGDCIVTVNGKDYTLSSVMEILDKAPEVPKDPEDPPATGGGEDGDKGDGNETGKTRNVMNTGTNNSGIGGVNYGQQPEMVNPVNPNPGSVEGGLVEKDPDAENSFGHKSPLETVPTPEELFPMSPILFDPTV